MDACFMVCVCVGLKFSVGPLFEYPVYNTWPRSLDFQFYVWRLILRLSYVTHTIPGRNSNFPSARLLNDFDGLTQNLVKKKNNGTTRNCLPFANQAMTHIPLYTHVMMAQWRNKVDEFIRPREWLVHELNIVLFTNAEHLLNTLPPRDTVGFSV